MRIPCFAGVLLLGSLVGLPLARAQYTEWPTTVQPGKFLLEMDALSLTIDRGEGYEYTAFGAASTFLTTGLTDTWDIQIGAEFFITQKFDIAGFTERDTGVGDVYFRTKYRFYDNPETGTAIAILPWIKIPTNTGGVGNDATEWGFIVPFMTNLPGGISAYAMAELDFLRNDDDDGYDSYWFVSAALNRTITSRIGVYGELAVGKSSGADDAEGTMGAGVTLSVSENVWWDLAMYKGITSGASDWNHVVRFNWGF